MDKALFLGENKVRESAEKGALHHLMTILITGATGFVGMNFIKTLVKQIDPAEIRCLVRNREKGSALATFGLDPEGPQIIHGDLLQPETYRHALQEVTTVFHIAALVGLKNGANFYSINTDGTHALLSSLQDSPHLKRLVYISSISAIDRPPHEAISGPLTETAVAHPNTDYGKSKLQGEQAIIASRIPYTILRPSYIYGPYPRKGSSIDRAIDDLKHQKPYTRFPFPGRASEIFVTDLAEAMWTVSQHPAAANEDFYVSNPEPITVGDFFRVLAAQMKVPYEPRLMSEEELARFYKRILRERPGDPLLRILYEDTFSCSPEKLKSLTGYQPRIGFESGLEQTIQWYRTHEGVS